MTYTGDFFSICEIKLDKISDKYFLIEKPFLYLLHLSTSLLHFVLLFCCSSYFLFLLLLMEINVCTIRAKPVSEPFIEYPFNDLFFLMNGNLVKRKMILSKLKRENN